LKNFHLEQSYKNKLQEARENKKLGKKAVKPIEPSENISFSLPLIFLQIYYIISIGIINIGGSTGLKISLPILILSILLGWAGWIGRRNHHDQEERQVR
jgi:hypothetical protein